MKRRGPSVTKNKNAVTPHSTGKSKTLQCDSCDDYVERVSADAAAVTCALCLQKKVEAPKKPVSPEERKKQFFEQARAKLENETPDEKAKRLAKQAMKKLKKVME